MINRTVTVGSGRAFHARHERNGKRHLIGRSDNVLRHEKDHDREPQDFVDDDENLPDDRERFSRGKDVLVLRLDNLRDAAGRFHRQRKDQGHDPGNLHHRGSNHVRDLRKFRRGGESLVRRDHKFLCVTEDLVDRRRGAGRFTYERGDRPW